MYFIRLRFWNLGNTVSKNSVISSSVRFVLLRSSDIIWLYAFIAALLFLPKLFTNSFTKRVISVFSSDSSSGDSLNHSFSASSLFTLLDSSSYAVGSTLPSGETTVFLVAIPSK